MTDDEIMALANEHADISFDMKGLNKQYEFDNFGLVAFARAIEQRTLTNQKARWYQIGAEAERHDIAKMVENYCGAWDDQGQALVQKIRARGEK